MMGEVQKLISRAWMAWALLSVGQAQIGEEPVRKAERVEEEVRPEIGRASCRERV